MPESDRHNQGASADADAGVNELALAAFGWRKVEPGRVERVGALGSGPGSGSGPSLAERIYPHLAKANRERTK